MTPRLRAGPVRAGRSRPRLLAVPGAVLALSLAACSAQAGGHGATSRVPAPTTSTTTTTTTTLPVAVPGTSFLRARVAALPRGAAGLPAVAPASAAWMKMVPIAYQSLGSGPDLLLIAGQDGTMSWWDPSLLADLSSHYRVTMFDLPGAGYSGAPTAPVSLAWLADMTAGFALTVGLSRPVVLGWGLGGEIALCLAERHQGLASSLILVDTSAGGPGAIPPTKGVVRLLGEPGATPLQLSKLLFPATSAGLQERVLWQNSLFAGTTDWLTSRSIKWQASLQASLWRSSLLAAGLPRVTTPALVVSGSDDAVFPAEDASLLGAGLPHATVLLLPGSGYGAITQDEPAFVAAVEKFTG